MNILLSHLVFLAAIFFILAGCNPENVVSEEEMRIQKGADYVVANLLFDKDMNENVSYNVRKNGSVVIKFDKSVSSEVYTNFVNQLRNDPRVTEVYAEQEGAEVCPLKF